MEPLKQYEDPAGGWGNGGCVAGQWEMMAISYVNKQFLYDNEEDA